MLEIVFAIISFPIKCVLIALIYIYKWCVSPFLAKKCAYYPTCSSFMLESIKEFGIIKGLVMGTRRLLRCNPRCIGGIDYVPYSIKGESKWIY